MENNNTKKETFVVLNMSCAVCASRVDKELNQIKGVKEAVVNLASASATIEYDPSIVSSEVFRSRLVALGYDMILETNEEDDNDEVEDAEKKKYKDIKNRTIWAIALSLPIVVISMFLMDIPYSNIIMWLLSTPVIFWLGRGFFINAFKQARHFSANMDTLVALSTGIAYIVSVFNMLFPSFWLSKGVHPHVYFEASSVIIAFILLGKLLENRAKGKTSFAIKKLMGFQPKIVTVISEDGKEMEISIKDIKKGDILIAKPGDRIAVDGVITKGYSYVDESMLSGESMAVLKQEGSMVYAGTINQKGSFNYRADKVGSQTMLSHIINMVKQAQGSKAPVQKLVDKIAGIFVPIIITISILSLIAWIFLDSQNGLTHGLLSMITVLIIACPCALGLATPTAIMVGIGKAAENGILIKDAKTLEVAKNIDTIILDKTGTITEGKPIVTDILWASENNINKSILISLEKLSEHPIAESIVNHFNGVESIQIEHFESLTGMGVRGIFENNTYFAGSRKLIIENNIEIDRKLEEYSNLLSKESKTIIYFANAKQVIAVLGIMDKIKETSFAAIKELKKEGLDIYILSGDNINIARKIAEDLGVENFKAEMLPQDKAAFIKELQRNNKKVCMVGDGINDSVALAQADLSIAMGKGSDLAMDIAGMTIISSELTKISKAIKLSRSTVLTIKQNLFWAFVYNIIAIPIAAGVLYSFNGFLLNPMIAGAAMAMSSVSVVTNSLRLRAKKI